MSDRSASIILRVIDPVAATALFARRTLRTYRFGATTTAQLHTDVRLDDADAHIAHTGSALWGRLVDGTPTTMCWSDDTQTPTDAAWSAAEWPAACPFPRAGLVPVQVIQTIAVRRSISTADGTPLATLTRRSVTDYDTELRGEHLLLCIDPAPSAPPTALAELCSAIEDAVACRPFTAALPFVTPALPPAPPVVSAVLSDHVRRLLATTRSSDDVALMPATAALASSHMRVLAAAVALVDGGDRACEPWFLALDPPAQEEVTMLAVPAQRSALLVPVAAAPAATTRYSTLLRTRLRAQFRRVLQREATLRQTYAAADIHRMRVSLRKLNSLIDCGIGLFDAESYAQYRRGFRRMSRFLGVLRDVDAFGEHVARILGTANVPAEIAQPLAKIRSKAQSDLVELMHSDRHGTFVQAFAVFVCADSGPPEPDTSAAALLEERISAMYTRLTAPMQTSAQRLDPEVLHDIRIDAKKLRYTLEAFSDVCSGTTPSFMRLLERLQQRLGVIQDAATAHQLLVDAHLMSNPTAKHILQTLRAEAQYQRSQLHPLWQRATSPEIATVIAGIIPTTGETA